MGKDGSNSGSKPGSKPATGSATRSAVGKGAKGGSKPARRVVVQIKGKSIKQQLADWLATPALFWGVLAYLAFVLVVGSTMLWTRSQTNIAVGQIMHETRTSRVEFNTEDVSQTNTRRTAARGNVPRVYNAEMSVLDEILADLSNLPKTLAGVSSLDEVERDIRVRFGLDESSFVALGAIASDDAQLERWRASLSTLNDILRRRPMLNRQSWQSATQEGLNTQIELRFPITGPSQDFSGGSESSGSSGSSGSLDQASGLNGPFTQRISRDDAINIDKKDQLAAEIGRIVRIAGFSPPVDGVVRKRLLNDPKPTFTYDAAITTQEMDKASERVLPVRQTITIGQRLYTRGDVLEQSAYALAQRENEEYRSSHDSVVRKWLGVVSIYAMIGAMGLLLGGYMMYYCPKMCSKPGRIGWMSGLLTAAIIAACVMSVYDPRLIWLGTITPVVLVAVLISIAYDQRTALALTVVVALIISMSLQVHTGLLAIMLIGIAGALAQISDLRERQTLIRMSVVIAFALSISTIIDQLINLPTIGASGQVVISAILGAGAQSFIAGLLVGGIALFILPFIEKVFDITTGMTLIELRDPKQPILRELQQRAPGTYNHSLNVASIAESAAEAIGADALLTYVGCLYHDIGKMNKPAYFIENQSGGINKHDKLTPAMSLLVIIGHVKDGAEMAREHGLPKSLRHFIEAHHGTTLVEYFYRRAREQASQADEDRTPEQILIDAAEQLPDEVDYRYPGPRPGTKEVAITMLSDAVESATRTLKDPTPARIDALVRSLANKRLMDGQFDECDLTFHELSLICESISKTVASIYHGRIRYSSDEDDDKAEGSSEKTPETPKTQSA